jgi:HPt (histidine-containing phosphotransfer) domain-containing protein
MTPGEFADIVASWLSDLATRIDGIVGLAQSGDLAAMERQAHNLAGVCGNCGALRLEQLGRKLMAACNGGEVAEVQRLVGDIAAARVPTEAAVRRRFPDHAA